MSFVAQKFKNFENLPKPLLIIHISSKLTFGTGFGLLLASYFKIVNWQFYGWLLIILAFIIALLRRFLRPELSNGNHSKPLSLIFLSLSFVRILCRFLLLFGIGLGTLLVSHLEHFNWKLYGWLLIILSIIATIPSNYRIMKK